MDDKRVYEDLGYLKAQYKALQVGQDRLANDVKILLERSAHTHGAREIVTKLITYSLAGFLAMGAIVALVAFLKR
jgi:hypothetical protein